jgi:polyisoprenoid-binding protein YceI
MYKKLLSLTLLTTSSLVLSAAPATFDFSDPKGVNHVLFMLDAPLEFISGTGTGISGTVDFDPAAPERTTGEIILTTDSLTVSNQKMTEVMHGNKWLNVAVNSNIRFSFNSLDVVSQQESTTTGNVTGTLSFLGVDQEMTVPVRITFVAGGAEQRGQAKGDLLVVRSEFPINLDTFGLNINPATRLKVSNEPQIKVIIAGYPKAEQ